MLFSPCCGVTTTWGTVFKGLQVRKAENSWPKVTHTDFPRLHSPTLNLSGSASAQAFSEVGTRFIGNPGDLPLSCFLQAPEFQKPRDQSTVGQWRVLPKPTSPTCHGSALNSGEYRKGAEGRCSKELDLGKWEPPRHHFRAVSVPAIPSSYLTPPATFLSESTTYKVRASRILEMPVGWASKMERPALPEGGQQANLGAAVQRGT